MNDISINETAFDLDIVNGDFVIAESTEQSLQFMLLATKGDFRELPVFGVDIANFLLSKDTSVATLRREIQIQTELDNFNLLGVDINLPNVKIRGNYA